MLNLFIMLVLCEKIGIHRMPCRTYSRSSSVGNHSVTLTSISSAGAFSDVEGDDTEQNGCSERVAHSEAQKDPSKKGIVPESRVASSKAPCEEQANRNSSASD